MRKWKWTKQNKERSEHVLAVADELRDWWPLTLRQIYYRLLANGYFMKDAWLKKNGEQIKNHYGALSTLVKWMRIKEHLSWEALEDRNRTLTDKRGVEDIDEFIEYHAACFLNGYERCLIQGQENHVEVWVEKDGLRKIFQDITDEYCLRTVICRGYQSISFIADFYKRASTAIAKGQRPVVLYFGDFDPSGVDMFEAAQRSLENELGLKGVYFNRCALNPEQVELFNLPTSPTAAKQSDRRYKKHVDQFGELAVELDALHPKELSELARESIESFIDMDFFNEQKEIEKIEASKIESLRADIIDFLHRRLSEAA